MSNKVKISVIGATGNLGAPVVKYLLDFGYSVQIIVRNLDKARNIFGENPNLEYSQADLEDVSSLKKALVSTQYLYLNLSTNTLKPERCFNPEREGVANILLAVNPQTICQIIAISGLGAFDNVSTKEGTGFVPNMVRKQGHKLLKDSGIPYTILHCSWFADSFVVYRRNNTYAVIGNPEADVYFTNCYNFTAHLVKAIGNQAAFYKEFPIQGNVAFKHAEAAQSFLSVYAPGAKVAPLSPKLLSVLAFFSQQMKLVKHMSDYFSNSKEEFLANEYDTFRVLGKPELSLSEYAQKLKNESVYQYLSAK